jgi:hypothetical protein
MRKGERIRCRRPVLAEREWGVPGDAEGTVLCQYRLLSEKMGAEERVDVLFGSARVVWGAPANEFVRVAEKG